MERVAIILFTYLKVTTHSLLNLFKIRNHNFLLNTLKWKTFHHLIICTLLQTFQDFPSHLRERTQNDNYIMWPVKKKRRQLIGKTNKYKITNQKKNIKVPTIS